MKVSVSDVNAIQKRVTVELPAEEVKPELDELYRVYAGKVRIKGFRPGKIPRNILKAFYGKFIEDELAQKFIDRTFPEALEQEGVHPLAEADLEDFSYLEDGGFRYVAVVEVAPQFEATGYRGLEIKKPVYGPVTDEDVQKTLEDLRNERAELESVEDGIVEEGVVVLCDITPYVEGRVDEERVEEDVLIAIGESSIYHPDFPRHLLGAKVGDTVEFTLTYTHSDQTPNEEWLGKDITFYVDIKQISKKNLPTIDDDFAKGLGFENLEELKNALRERIERDQEGKIRALMREQIGKKLLELHDIPVPEKAVHSQTESKIRDLEMQYLRQGIKLDEETFRTPAIRRLLQPEAETTVKLGIVLDRIAEQEGIELTPEEEEEMYRNLAGVLKRELEEVKKQMAGSSLLEKMRTSKIQEKVYELIERNAIIQEVSPEEFFKDKQSEDTSQGNKEEK